MKKHILICVLIAICAIHAQSQNLKFGKPTDEELNMTVYEQDPNASAVVLCNLTTVNYSRESFRYLVDYNVKKRIKILKDNGKDYANMSIKYINNPYEDFSTEEILDFNATAYNMENGKVVKTKIDFHHYRNAKIDFSIRKFKKLCKQYFLHEKPLANITKCTKFCDLDFCVKRKVLAPRENTEKMT